LKQHVGVVEELAQLYPVLLEQVSRLAVVPAMMFIAARASMPFDWNILIVKYVKYLGGD
jgi:hypothetical protein